MKLIMKQDVAKVGTAGTVVEVKEGYARNFLLPKGLAVKSTPAELKKLQQEQQRKTLEFEKGKQESEEIKKRLAGISLTIPVLTKEEDKIYGSITTQDIAAALKEEGFSIDKTAIMLTESLKAVGIYEVPVRLHSDVTASVKVWIVKK